MQWIRIRTISRGESFTVTVNGRPMRAYPGETVHAVLMVAGILDLRISKSLSEPRGAFCGMGICYECLVTINKEPNQRACMRLVEPGMEILTHAADL